MIEDVALERGHEIVCRIDKPTPTPSLKGGEKIFSPEEGFKSKEFRSADVAIEFTTPATAKDNILRAWAQGVPVVSGSTGWDIAFGNQIAQTDDHVVVKATDASALPKNWKFSGTPNKWIVTNEHGKVMLVWSSNFSIGVNIFFNLNRYLAEEIQNAKLRIQNDAGGYTPSIKEIHHIHKLDKPSGTAKTLAEAIKANGERLEANVPIESIRKGEVPGTHTVTWDSEEDTIVITHIAKGRRGFALGAVLAAEGLKR